MEKTVWKNCMKKILRSNENNDKQHVINNTYTLTKKAWTCRDKNCTTNVLILTKQNPEPPEPVKIIIRKTRQSVYSSLVKPLAFLPCLSRENIDLHAKSYTKRINSKE